MFLKDLSENELPGKPEWFLKSTEDAYFEDFAFRAQQIVRECVDPKPPEYEPKPGWVPLGE